jgi:hypothetical protein
MSVAFADPPVDVAVILHAVVFELAVDVLATLELLSSAVGSMTETIRV